MAFCAEHSKCLDAILDSTADTEPSLGAKGSQRCRGYGCGIVSTKQADGKKGVNSA